MGKQTPDNKKRVYRLSLVDNDTHQSIRSYRFTRYGFMTLAISAAILFILLIYCLIAFTPIRNMIPGYPDSRSRKEAIANAIKIDSLENDIRRWEFYASNLSKVLAGEEAIPIDSLIGMSGKEYLNDKSMEELAAQDSLLHEAVDKAAQFEVGAVRKNLPIEGMHFFAPLKGVLTQGFDIALHPAIDISAPANSVVCASLDGTIIATSWNDNAGYTVIMQHDGDVVTSYGHNEKLLKGVGDKVKAGAPIALVGSSSSLISGDHLRFEVWYKGEPVDPAKLISF